MRSGGGGEPAGGDSDGGEQESREGGEEESGGGGAACEGSRGRPASNASVRGDARSAFEWGNEAAHRSSLPPPLPTSPPSVGLESMASAVGTPCVGRTWHRAVTLRAGTDRISSSGSESSRKEVRSSGNPPKSRAEQLDVECLWGVELEVGL